MFEDRADVAAADEDVVRGRETWFMHKGEWIIIVYDINQL